MPSSVNVAPGARKQSPIPIALKHLVAIFVVLIVAGCSGGGCTSGCSSCGGITPLAEGFNAQKRIENAGSVRVTQSGLDFLASNLGPLAKSLIGGGGSGAVITFPIPATTGGAFPATYDVCPGGADPNANPMKCIAEIDAGNADVTIAPQGPYDLHITGTLPIRLANLPINFAIIGIPGSATGVLTGNGQCPGQTQTFDQFPLDVDIAIHIDSDMTHSRYGYSLVEVKTIVNDQDAQDNLSAHLTFCGGIGASILNLVKPLVIGQLYGGLIGTLKPTIEEQLCQKANPMLNPTCPTGTLETSDGICRYTADPDDTAAKCASIILGVDGNINLGGLLASISPGTKGGLDFLFAAGGPSKRDDNSGYSWGDLNPVANGATLGMYGGAEPLPVSKCVKFADMPLPTGIPIPTELFGNTVPNWPAALPGPHIGLAFSERFANYGLNAMYNSGLLCLGISTENIGLLNSGTLGLLAASSKDLGLQREPQQVAIVVRPSSPPSITFGNGTDIKTDPLLDIKLNKAAFDFYIFSLDRFIRFMTATFDLDVPVNLSVGPDGLTPVLDKLGVTNAKLSNNQLIRENPDTVAQALGDLIAGQVGQQLGAGIAPIDLNSALASLGLKLVIPDTVKGEGSPGLVKLTKGTDNYLGIFASLEIAGGASPNPPPPPPSETSAKLMGKSIDRNGLRFATSKPDNAPKAKLQLGSNLDDGTRTIEFSYRVDKGFWHPFTRERYLEVSDEWLRVQGKHVIQVRSRVAGVPDSLDMTPESVEVIVDAEPPALKIGRVEDGKVALTVKDLVSNEDMAMVRVKLDDGEFGAWRPSSVVRTVDVGDATSITIEARDEEGNVATSRQALIRGRDTSGAAGCGCVVAGSESPRGAVWLLGAALAGVAARLFRRSKKAQEAKAVREEKAASPSRAKQLARHTIGAVAAMALASSWAGCNCGVETTGFTSGGSSSSGGPPPCPDCIKLEAGLIGAYTSVAVNGKDLWVAGYSEADYDNGFSYGDLVVGKFDGTAVAWEQVDGVPSDPAPDPKVFDTSGFRGGQTEAGDDVGLWTSIAIDPKGNPAVAYYDRTHQALKFAQSDGAGGWMSHTVDFKMKADYGRYAKMLVVDGAFVIAYLTIEAGGAGGQLVSKVKLATSKSATPAAPADWTFEDVVVNDKTPCRAVFCESGTSCMADTKACETTLPASMCNPQCASGEACIDNGGTPTCILTFDASKIDAYPDVTGDYIAIAPDPAGGFGIAYYDRVNGNLGIASKAGGKWTTLVVDGADAQGNETGDVGIGATLFIDASGDWHLVYVDGLSEGLKYAKVGKDKKIAPFEIVDDGLSIDGKPFDDGLHLVGDDAHVVVIGGEVHVTYQDATAGKLHHAVGKPGADKHFWTVTEVQQDGFAGAFSHIAVVDGKLKLVNWWRVGGMDVKGDVAVVSP